MSKAITKAAILVLNNFDGWQLEYNPSDQWGYDAYGHTPKNIPCVIKFHYDNQEPYINKQNYDKLMSVHDGVTILYVYVSRSINYLFWIPQVRPKEDGDILWLNKKDAKLINFGERIL